MKTRPASGTTARFWPSLLLALGSPAAQADSPTTTNAPPLQTLSLSRFVEVTSLEALGEMVITDAKVPQAPDSVTQQIAVLRPEDLANLPDPHGNLASLMRYTSGQFVNVLSRNDANWGSYGGLGPKYNSYLLDGVPIDALADTMSLNPDAIERVEIHKGPASVLYSNYLTMDFVGNQTPLAGTTNLVLRQQVEQEMTRLSLGAGTWNTQAGRLYHQGRQGNLSYRFGLAREQSDYTQTNYEYPTTLNSPDYAKTQGFSNLHYALGRPDHAISLFLHHTDHRGDQGRPHRDYQHRYDTVNVAYSNQFSDNWHVQFKAGERRYDRGFANDNYPASLDLSRYENTRQIIRPMDLSVSYLHGQNSLLTFGADTQQVHYWTENRDASGIARCDNDARATSTGYFIQEKIQWQDWVFRIGARHNRIQQRYSLLGGQSPAITGRDWNKTLWSLGIRYRIAPALSLYANAGSSFMPPAAKQIGGTVSSPGASGELANPNLRPETGMGRDIGLDWQATPALRLGVRAFFNTVDDAIVTNVVSVVPSQVRSENAGRVQARGLEFNLRHAPSETLDLFANLTRTDSRIDHPGNPDAHGSAMPFTPDLVANAGLTTRLPGGLTVSPYLQWVGRYYDSASRADRKSFGQYSLLNMRLQWPLARDTRLFLDLNNLTDRRHDMPFSFRDPGCNVFAGVSLNF